MFGLIWLLAALGLVAGGLGLALKMDWWDDVAFAGAIASITVVVIWWKAVPVGARVGLLFNLLLIVFLTTPIKDWFMGVVNGS